MLGQGLVRPGSYHTFEVFEVFVVLYKIWGLSLNLAGKENPESFNPYMDE